MAARGTGLAFLASLSAVAAWARVETYTGPAGIAASDQYSVTVKQGGVARDSFVYSHFPRGH